MGAPYCRSTSDDVDSEAELEPIPSFQMLHNDSRYYTKMSSGPYARVETLPPGNA